MRNVVVTGCPRADLGEVGALVGLGVATVHEAIGRTGYLGPGIRPGVRGLVTAGGVRDVAELHAMGFPVFCAAVSARGMVKLAGLGIEYVDHHACQEGPR
jgi:regulator of RNase E activity RraA